MCSEGRKRKDSLCLTIDRSIEEKELSEIIENKVMSYSQSLSLENKNVNIIKVYHEGIYYYVIFYQGKILGEGDRILYNYFVEGSESE